MTIASVGISDFDALLEAYREQAEIRPGLPETEVYEDALYTPTSSSEKHDYRGALFDSDGEAIASADLVRVHERLNGGSPEPARGRLRGTGIYLGWAFGHYGHGLLEGLSRCWALGEHDFALYHSPQGRIPGFLAYHLDRLGAPPVVIPSQPTLLERVVVPQPAFEISMRAYTGFLDVFPRGSADDPRPVYVSRTRLRASRRLIVGEDVLERALSGYRIVHPETLAPDEQVEVFSSHSTFAGTIGSGMHNILFSRSPRVVYLTDHRPHPSYMMCDKLVEADSLYVGCCDLGGLPSLGRSTPMRLDLVRAAEALEVEVDASLQDEIDRRHRDAWAEFRLKQGVRAGDRSAVGEVREHHPGPWAPQVEKLARRLDPTVAKTPPERGRKRSRPLRRRLRRRLRAWRR